jgi:hypothetical protein
VNELRTLLDDVLPDWHFRERHRRRVDADPERVFAAVRQLTLADTPVTRVLVRLRGMHARTDRPILDEMRDVGFEVEAEQPSRELVFAAIGQPWKLRGGERRRGSEFRAFAEPGYAKMAFNFRLDGSTLSTETRVLLTDERSRRSFRRYWLVIRPFSGLIRRIWLRAIARRAQA